MTNKFLEQLERRQDLCCSFIATATALLAAAIAGAGASVASGVIGSKAATGAAQTQAEATKSAAQLSSEATQASLSEQKREFDTNQQNLQPWLQSGQGALGQLNTMLAPGGTLQQGYSAALPTAPGAPAPFDPNSVKFDPGFQYRMDQSNKALQQWAAARGGLFSGGTGQKLVRNAQDMTSQEYQNAYSRDFGAYQQNYQNQLQSYGAQLQGYGTGANTFYANQANLYNRLAGLAGTGQTAANQLAVTGTQAAAGIGATGVQGAAAQGAAGEAGAAATAAGQVGSANAFTGALNGIGSNFTNFALLSALLGANGGSTGGAKAPSNQGVPNFNPFNTTLDSFVPGYA